MSHGILIRGDSLGIQLSSESPNYELAVAGTATLNGSGYVIVPIPAGLTAPMVFASGSVPAFFNHIDTGETAGIYIGYPIGATGSLAYRIYAPARELDVSDEQYGMRVWDADGNLTFDSGRRPLSIRYAGAITRSSAGATINHGITDGMVCLNAFSPSKSEYHFVSEPPLIWNTRHFGFIPQASGTTVVVAHVEIGFTFLGGNGTQPDPYDGATVPILVIAP